MLTGIDIFIMIIIGISMVFSFMRGFVKECLSLIVWVLAIWWTFQYHGHLANLLPWPVEGPWRTLTAIVAMFLAILLTGGLVNHTISKLMHQTGLKSMDRFIGLGFGFARGWLVVALIYLGFNALAPQQMKNELTENSQLVPVVENLTKWFQQQRIDAGVSSKTTISYSSNYDSHHIHDGFVVYGV